MKILHLEDNPHDAELVRELVAQEWPESEIRHVSTKFAYVGELSLWPCDVILSDFTLAAFNGMDALKLAKERAPDTPFIFISGTIGEDRAIEALQSGAQDYVIKDRMKRLITAIHRALRESEERKKRLQAERQIREQAEMLNQAREAIIITSLENRIIYWNTGAERIYGWTSDEAVGQTAAQLFPNQTELDRLESAWATTRAQGEWHGEMALHHHGGGALIVDMRQTLVRDETGAAKARLSISTDITEKKRLEEQFLRAQRMENIGLLAAGIAHDLNNMLAPILMAAPLLRESVTEPGGLTLLDTLEKSAERGAALVRQILAFSHGVGGGHQLVPVKHLLRDIASIVASTFPKAVQLDDHIPGDLWPINANPTQIHQVLLNLCVNARDAMPRGGTMRLRAENCTLDATAAQAIDGGRPGDFVVLQVEDTGTGIAPDVLQHMWEPFFTTKEADKGTGLGLSTVRGIVRNHGGFVELRTAVGRGTCFRVYLPAAETSAGGPARALSSPIPRGNGELILIVDDETDISEMAAKMLTRAGYCAVAAGDGAEAAAIFAQRASEIRLVVSDLHMPGLDGAMLARVLQRIDPTVKILFMSGLADRAGVGNGPAVKPEEFAAAFLGKPFTAQALLAKVGELLRTPAAPDESTP